LHLLAKTAPTFSWRPWQAEGRSCARIINLCQSSAGMTFRIMLPTIPNSLQSYLDGIWKMWPECRNGDGGLRCVRTPFSGLLLLAKLGMRCIPWRARLLNVRHLRLLWRFRSITVVGNEQFDGAPRSR